MPSRPTDSQLDPFRAPAWRWESIQSLFAHTPPQRPPRGCDEWVRTFWRFYSQWLRFENHRERVDRLFPSNPALFRAFEYYIRADPEDLVVLEASILARVSPKAIGKKFGLSPDAVEWFERLFFDVRDRLDRPYYIRKVIEGKVGDRTANRAGSMASLEKSVMIKKWAYYGRAYILDFMLTGFYNVPPPKRAGDVGLWIEGAFNSTVLKEGLTAISKPHRDKSDMQWLQLVQKTILQAQRDRAMSSEMAAFLQNIEALGEVLSIQMADKYENLLPALPNGQKRRKGLRELRSAEQLQLTAGRNLAPFIDQEEAEIRERLAQPNQAPDDEGPFS
jgi:hypothetical protein